MAIVGHFEDLDEAQKLVQSKLLAGVVQEVIEEGQLLPLLPVMTIDSKSVLYNRESTLPSAAFYDIHEQIPWTADTNYTTQQEATLKRVARQDVLDKFMLDTYKDPNDYRAIILSELRKGCMRTIEDKLIFGDIDNDAAEFDGISHLFDTDAAGSEVFTSATNPQMYDMGGSGSPLSLMVLRQLIDVVRPKPDILVMSRTMRNVLSAAAFEKGIVLQNAQPVGTITYGQDQFGKRIGYFDGIRILVSDYMLNEVDDTGDKDDGNDSGVTSVYAIRFGQIIDGGLCLCTGGSTGGVDFFKMTELEALEDYDASGIRLTAYCCLALGSSKALGRITSIDEDGAIVA
jgi:hypothetical protein